MQQVPDDEAERFDTAVMIFQGEGKVEVTPDRLRAFLALIKEIEWPDAEKLRRLAIVLEFGNFAEGWAGLRAIYQAAAQADPQNADVYSSWGISAMEWAEVWQTSDLIERSALAEEAERMQHKALEIEPHASFHLHQLGLVYYSHPQRKTNELEYLNRASECFQQALSQGTACTMSQLYLAHCAHDRAMLTREPQDWYQAAALYTQVDQVSLAAVSHPWRSVKCREQLAACLAWANDPEATLRIENFLDELETYESVDWSDETCQVVNLDELVDVVQNKLRESHLLERTRAEVRRRNLMQYYPLLFPEILATEKR